MDRVDGAAEPGAGPTRHVSLEAKQTAWLFHDSEGEPRHLAIMDRKHF